MTLLFNVFKDELDSETSRPETPRAEHVYKYDTFCCEPRITIDDITKQMVAICFLQ